MRKIWLVIIPLMLLPYSGSAFDLSKGLLESPDNLQKKSAFLRGGAGLAITNPEVYPTSIFLINSGRSIKFSIQTDKYEYQAGEKVQVSLSASNNGFYEGIKTPTRGKKIYYLWSGGNFFVEAYRLSDEVKEGEYLVASGKAYGQDSISLYQNEKKEFKFSWVVPENAKSGTYEIKVYPTSAGILFRGNPQAYRSLLKTRIAVAAGSGKEAAVSWDLDGIKLGDENIHLKEKSVYLDSNSDYNLSIPLKNSGGKKENVKITKQIYGSSYELGSLINQEAEEISLEPGEEKPVNYFLTKEKIKGEPVISTLLGFSEIGEEGGSEEYKYFDFPAGSFGGEAVFVPLYMKSNIKFNIWGLGIRTVNGSPDFSKGSFLTPFVEIERSDPLFFRSAGKERMPEDNLRLSLLLQDKGGGRIDEIAYEGPSWDRSGQIYKVIELAKNYKGLKLTAVLGSQNKGEIERKEIEYLAPEKAAKSKLDKIKEMLENYWIALAVAAVVILAAIGILAVVLIMRKKINTNP
ncbi:MAG: hypothetical protein V1690_01890 [Candidatus Moraniibacteriota bacterium]